MKKLLCIVFVIALLGCKKGESSPTAPTTTSSGGTTTTTTTTTTTGNNAPTVSDLFVLPSEKHVGAGGGAVSVAIVFYYNDQDGDVTTTYFQPTGEAIASKDLTTSSTYQGGYDGTGFSLNVDTSQAKTVTFKVWAVDSKGNESNKLSGKFSVI